MYGYLQSQNLNNKINQGFSNQQFNEESYRQRGPGNLQVTTRAEEFRAGMPLK